MRRDKIIASLVTIFALSGTPGATASTVALGQSHALYFGKYETSQSGIVVDSGMIFSTVIIPYRKNATRKSVTAKAMIAAWQQIAEHFDLDASSSSTGSVSLDRALSRQKNIKLKRAPFRILVNRKEGTSYRYVLATEESAVKSLLTSETNESIKPENVANVLQRLQTGKNYRYLSQILAELGLPELALQWEKKELAKQYCISNYYQPPKQPFLERQKLKDSKADPVAGLKWLCELPASPDIIDNHLKQNSVADLTTLAFESTALPARSPEAISRRSTDNPENPLVYLKKLSRKTDLSTPYTAVLSFPGHIVFSRTFSDQPNQAFADGKSLFEQGRELDTIIALLQDSANQSPGYDEVWQYLGAALMAKRNWSEAAVAYLQWMTLDPGSLEAISRYAEALHRMGLTEAAGRFAPYLRFHVATNKFANNTIQLIEKK